MSSLTGRMRTYGFEKQQNDPQENRQRVATYSENKTFSYENSVNATVAQVLDYHTDSGKIAHKGYFINDGPGDVTLEFSPDGTLYGGVHTIKGGEQVDLTDFTIFKVRVTGISDTSYRCLLM